MTDTKNELAISQPMPTNNFLQIISKAASDPNTDVAKMHGLLDVLERGMRKEAEQKFNIAFGKLQKSLGDFRIRKGGKTNNAKYARYEDIDAVLRPLMTENGFTLRFSTLPDNNKLVVKGTLSHEDGHSIETVTPITIDANPKVMNSQQAVGSASSYGMRYIAKMLFNLVYEGEDDDGVMSGYKKLSVQQAKILKDLLQETNSDVLKFLAHFQANSVDEMSVQHYDRAYNILVKKKAMQNDPS